MCAQEQRVKTSLAVLTIAFLVGASICLADTPGGYLVEAISDECDTVNPIWGPGLRGMPEFLFAQDGLLSIRSMDNGDDPYPSAEDMISTYSDQIGRALDASEKPSVVSWVWLPPLSEWPAGYNPYGFREWLGFRVTAYDPNLSELGGYYFPGIYIATDDAGPCLIARAGDGYTDDVTIGRISATGWWTLGLSWNDQGRTEYYAAPGRVTLTSADLLYTIPTFEDPAANRSISQLIGNFWALRMTYPPTGELSPNWLIDFDRVYLGVPPALPRLRPSLVDGQFRLEIDGCARGFRYLLQRSSDLMAWTTVQDRISDGNLWIFEEPVTDRRFYRVALP
jgi:hypothetical protein